MSTLKALVQQSFAALGFEIKRISGAENFPYPEASAAEIATVRTFEPYTMSGIPRQWSLLRCIDYIDAHGIPGAIVECGVWRGGNMMMASAHRKSRTPARDIYLFDTFAGMSAPTEVDRKSGGTPAAIKFAETQEGDFSDWCKATLPDVKSNFAAFDLPDPIFVEGMVEQTLCVPSNLPAQIAILRLDTDWYESTKKELEVLYPRLISGGVLILDDYGSWQGAKKAVDEYFAGRPPLLCPVDASCRVAIKP